MPRAVVAVLAIAVSTVLPQQQNTFRAATSAAITGTVVDGSSRTPIADALVLVQATGASSAPQTKAQSLTDDLGRFAFSDLTPGRYTLLIRKSGFADAWFGASQTTSAPSSEISLVDGEWRADLTVILSRLGGIRGRVFDERREPLVGIYVRALAEVNIAGARHLAGGPVAVTDDRGMFRIAGLSSGRYLVVVPSPQSSAIPGWSPGSGSAFIRPASASPAERTIDVGGIPVSVGHFPVPPPPSGDRPLAYPVTFAGGALAPGDAPIIEVTSGIDATAADTQLLPVPAYRARGTLVGSPQDVRGRVVRLVPIGLEELGLGCEAATTVTAADGAFQFPLVPAGSYTVDAPTAFNEFVVGQSNGLLYDPMLPRPPGLLFGPGQSFGTILTPTAAGIAKFSTIVTAAQSFATLPVTLGREYTTFPPLTLRTNASVSGRVDVMNPAGRAETKPSALVILDPEDGDARQGNPTSGAAPTTAEGGFAIASIRPGRYFVRRPADGWLIKSVVVEGRPLANDLIDLSEGQSITSLIVTLTHDAPVLTGIVRGPNNPADDVAVIAFPANRPGWTAYGRIPSRIQVVTTDKAGAFRFVSLPAGDYLVIAVPQVDSNAWRDPTFFPRVAQLAMPVHLDWSSTATRNPRLLTHAEVVSR